LLQTLLLQPPASQMQQGQNASLSYGKIIAPTHPLDGILNSGSLYVCIPALLMCAAHHQQGPSALLGALNLQCGCGAAVEQLHALQHQQHLLLLLHWL
jgi:hypothetical protein